MLLVFRARHTCSWYSANASTGTFWARELSVHRAFRAPPSSKSSSAVCASVSLLAASSSNPSSESPDVPARSEAPSPEPLASSIPSSLFEITIFVDFEFAKLKIIFQYPKKVMEKRQNLALHHLKYRLFFLRSILQFFTQIVLSVHKLNKLGKFW